MHVDGFRFDLAAVLGRDNGRFRSDAGFFKAVAAEPSLRYVKLIAEPWDIGPDGYQLRHFPAGWSEWNDLYRDTMRGFWRGNPGVTRQLRGALRRLERPVSFHGPPADGEHQLCRVPRRLHAVRRHCVQREAQRSESRREPRRSQPQPELELRCRGTDGRSEVIELRERQIRNMMATLLLSQGVPMLLAGDEFGRTQLGNNNAYCQDNELSWIDWDAGRASHLADRVRAPAADPARSRARLAARHVPEGSAAGSTVSTRM